MKPLPKSVFITLALCALATIYIFQRFDFLSFLLSMIGQEGRVLHPWSFFIFNKTLRLVLNDACCFVLIYALFHEKKYLNAALVVFLVEMGIVLPVYFVIKLSLEGDSEISSPLLSQIHRLIVNPTLMILLMIAFYYQRFLAKKQTSE